MIVKEAATTFILIIDTATHWIEVLAGAAAFVLCVIAYALGPLVAPPARAVRRRVAPSWARGRARARRFARSKRDTPHADRTDPEPDDDEDDDLHCQLLNGSHP